MNQQIPNMDILMGTDGGGMPGPVGWSPQPLTQPPIPIPYGGAGLPPSASLGTYPLTPNAGGLPYPAIPPSVGGGDPNVALWEATMNESNARTSSIAARDALLAQQPRQLSANANVFGAQERDIGQTKAFLAEQTRANESRIAELKGIQGAQGNVADLTAIARGQRERDTMAYRYQLAGLPAPVEIKMPPGYNGPMPAGTVARLQTLAEILTEKAGDKEAMRKLTLEMARIKAEETGQEVRAAQIASGRVALDLDQLELAVSRAGLDVERASLATGAARLPYRPGMAWDDVSGQWTTPLSAQLSGEAQLSEARARTAAEKAGTYGMFTESQLVGFYASHAIETESQLRQGLRERNPYMSNEGIEVLVRAAREDRRRFDESRAADTGGRPPSSRSGGATSGVPLGGGGQWGEQSNSIPFG